GTTSTPLISRTQGTESKPQSTCSPEPLMVGMDLEYPETRSWPLSMPVSGRGIRQRLPRGRA
ncbi:unnamed protein product, partial [Staurois parvus]